MIDYHIHTSRCCHATGTMEEYLAEAERKGLSEIGFADHFPLEMLGFTPGEPVSMTANELPAYLADVKNIRDKASISVRTGIEVDYLPGREAVTGELLAAYPFDYVIGSVHFIDGLDFTHPRYTEQYESINMDELYEKYFRAVIGLAESALFDIVGHLDVIKKFALFPDNCWDHLVQETCEVLADKGLCVELNSAGWRAPVSEAYPGEAFLKECLRLDIPVTFGSDAHCPKDVGAGMQRAVALLKGLGFSEIATFAARKRIMRPL